MNASRLIAFCVAVSALLLAAWSHANDYERLYDHMIEANKAQLVMLAETGLITDELARQLAGALQEVVDEGMRPQGDGVYPDYLDLEARLVALIGHDASNIHLGRSRNDLGATMNLMLMRQQILGVVNEIGRTRETLQDMAAQHVDTLMPGFTHGVQAQPTTLAHFLLAFDAGLQRDAERLQQAYLRINRSPLGAGAFTTSGFPLNRERLAELLGFPALVVNSYDAIMVNPADTKLELATALSISALNISRFAQYVLFQYDDSAPGLLLADETAGRSSIMPQKRNPSLVERLRLAASEVVGRAHMSSLMVHNTPMYEVKDVRQDHLYRLNELVSDSRSMYRLLDEVLRALTIRVDRLRQIVDEDYSTLSELADTLKREAGVPFRVGHEVASELTTYGRAAGKAPAQLSYEEVAAVYSEVVHEDFPLSREQTRKALDAAEFVASRKGIGGPQADSVRQMLESHRQGVAELERWTENERARLAEAGERLNREFSRLTE